MKRFIITLAGILTVFAAMFYLFAIPHEWVPQSFRFALFTSFLGFSFAMALYHLFLYVFTARERIYLIFTAMIMLMITRFFTVRGGVAELIASDSLLPVLYHISEVTMVGFAIFGIWFAHGVLRIKWGGLPMRIVYIVTLGVSLVMTVATGQVVGTWWFMLYMIPRGIVIIKGFLSKYCRSNPFVMFFLITEIMAIAVPLVIMLPFVPQLYMPHIPFWLLMIMVQSVILSQSYGEAKRREKELAEEKSLLEKLNRTKSEFYGNISHEMKTPLTIIITDMEIAEQFMNEGNLNGARELLREGCIKAMQMSGHISDALAFARNQETAKPMEYFDFGETIDATLSVYEPLIKKHGNILEKDIGELLKIKGNANMLADALINLLHNANRHTECGVISVTWKIENDKLCLSVRDTGSGIPDELLPRVFERGVTDGTGTGLGLALVKKVTEIHGGEASIQSKAGKGTTVTLAFPASVEDMVI